MDKNQLVERIKELEAEIEQLHRQINGYVTEFRVCRFCAEIHSDCTPNDARTCFPRWRGL